jgi:hypothetical protein
MSGKEAVVSVNRTRNDSFKQCVTWEYRVVLVVYVIL